MNTKLINKYDLLIDTCSFYTSGNRGVYTHGIAGCHYRGFRPNGETTKCSVGRLLTEKKLKNIENRGQNGTYITNINLEKKDLKKKYSSMIGELSFLGNLQSLHDCSDNWDSFGLTGLGLEIAFVLLRSVLFPDDMITEEESGSYMDRLNEIFAKADKKRQRSIAK